MTTIPRCGRISYTNDLPVYSAIDDDVVLFPGSMIAGVPAQLNGALLDGDLDISPISSAFYAAHNEDFVLLPDVCIGASGRVHSICLVSKEPPELLSGQTIATTNQSATGRMLFALMCQRHFGFTPAMVDSDDPFAQYLANGTACLLIGDKAIDATEQAPFACIYDLGQLWFDHSGMGMVYAVWAARRDFAVRAPEQVRGVAASLRSSLQWGLEHKEAVIARAQASKPRAPGFYEQYYQALRFSFDEAAQAALVAFFDAAYGAGLLKRMPSLQFYDEVPQHV